MKQKKVEKKQIIEAWENGKGNITCKAIATELQITESYVSTVLKDYLNFKYPKLNFY